jgi:lipoprotein NlpI
MPSAFQKFCQFVCITGTALLASPAIAQQSAPTDGSTADSWVKFGVANGMKGDLTAAIAAFDEAIKTDPNWAPAYECRGHALSLESKLDDAIIDYTKAIEIDPKYEDAYYDRAVAKAQKGSFDDALADFNRAIELNPKFASAYYNRGHVKYFKGDLDGAIADLNQAVTLDPGPPFSYFIRGLARLAKDDREGAVADFQQSAINGYPEAAFWLWIVKMEKGEQGEARSDLSDMLGKHELFKPDNWPTPIGNFLLEKMTQYDLMAIAKKDPTNQENLCEAWFFSGFSKRFTGDIPGAIDCFQKAAATASKESELSVEAQRQAASLQKP